MDNKNSNLMTEELQHQFNQLEATLQSGSFSCEGLDYLVNKCHEADPSWHEAAIAVLALTRNTARFRAECEKLYEWACVKYGKELIDRSVQIYVDKVYLSALFKQQF